MTSSSTIAPAAAAQARLATRPSQKEPVAAATAAQANAPTMYREPCARLISPMTPKISVSPAAMRNNMTPS